MNRVLWHLDAEISDQTFERLCVDLLYRNGYHDIDPHGRKRDRGRDAEVRRRAHILLSPRDERTYFQFSLADRWERKIRDELEKVRNYGHEIETFFFVTTATVTGHKRDSLRDFVRRKYNWTLEIRDREWLRLQLEEGSPDLAEKYLGIAAGAKLDRPGSDSKPSVTINTTARALYDAGDYDAAAVEFRRYLRKTETDTSAWRALAWCHYMQRHYQDALIAINRAVKLHPHDLGTQRILGCILIESGIQERKRASVVRGKDIFADTARTSETWTDHYNLANALNALGDHEGARDSYTAATGIDPSQATAWKNLGSVYEKLRDTAKALECYEKALVLDPNLSEALLAKGILLIRNGDDPVQGATLLSGVLDRHDAACAYWGPAWYWAAYGYYRGGRPLDALRLLADALGHIPNHAGLLDLKAQILSEVWRNDAALLREAQRFFSYRAEVSPDDFRPVEALGRIYLATDRSAELSGLLKRFSHDTWPVTLIESIGGMSQDLLTALRHVDAYKRFRQHHSIDDYAQLFSSDVYSLTHRDREALYWSFAQSFGLAFQQLYEADPRDEAAYYVAFESQLQRVRVAMIQWVRYVASNFSEPSQSDRLSIMSTLISACAWTAFLEASRSVGFLSGFFGLPIDPATAPLPTGLDTFASDVAVEAMLAVNETLKLFRDA